MIDKDGILMIVCMDLPITTTNAGQWSNSLIFHENIKCTDGQTKIYVCTN